MRILMATGMNSTKYGSLEKWILLLGEELNSRGDQLILHYNSTPASKHYLELLAERGVETRFGSPGKNAIRQVASYRKIIRECRPDIVFSMFSSKSVYAAASLGVPKTRNLWMNHLEVSPRRGMRRFNYAVIDHVAKVYAVSDAVRGQMVKAGFSASNVETWYLGLPVELIDAVTEEPQRPEPNTVVSVAHYRHVKGTDLLLRAFAKVLTYVPDAHLIQVGIDHQRAMDFLKLSNELGIAHAIEWRGIQEEAFNDISRGSVYVQPSRSEALGLAILEAEYLCRPVVAFRVGGIPEVVQHGESGFLVEPENVDQMAQAIIDLLRDTGRSEGIGEKGRALVEQNFLSGSLIRKTLENSRAFSQ